MAARSISPPPLKRRRISPPPATKPATPSSLRIYAWNINGIKPFLQRSITSFFAKAQSPSDAEPAQASLRGFLRRHSWPHMLLLQEVKIAPTDLATQRSVSAAVAAPVGTDEPGYQAFFTLPTDKHNARGFGRKVYGVCSIVRSDLIADQKVTVRTVDWDQEGRFNVIETAGECGWPKLSVWNVYAVNGTDFDYRNSETGEVFGTRHERKLEVHRLMVQECRRLEKEGYGVIIAGDLNVARAPMDGFPRLRTKPEQHVKNRAHFNQWMFDKADGLQAVDTFRELHPLERRYTWYSRTLPWGESCDRVDYVLCSSSLRQHLCESGMLDSEQERGPSDHVPVFAGFTFGEANGSNT